MKKILVILLILLVVVLGAACYMLWQNEGHLLPQPEPTPTEEPAEPTEAPPSALGDWVLYKWEESSNMAGNKDFAEKELPAEWKDAKPKLTMNEADFMLEIHKTKLVGKWDSDANGEAHIWARRVAASAGVLAGIFNVNRVETDGEEVVPTEYLKKNGRPYGFIYKKAEDELIVVKDGGEGTDMTDYWWFKR